MTGYNQGVVDTIKKDIVRVLGIPAHSQMTYDKFF